MILLELFLYKLYHVILSSLRAVRGEASTQVMAWGVISLGAVPARESFTRAGEADEAGRALSECQRFVALLRHVIGPEPHGARLRIRRAEPDRASRYQRVMTPKFTGLRITVDNSAGGTASELPSEQLWPLTVQ